MDFNQSGDFVDFVDNKTTFSGILFICAFVESFASLAELGPQMTLRGRK